MPSKIMFLLFTTLGCVSWQFKFFKVDLHLILAAVWLLSEIVFDAVEEVVTEPDWMMKGLRSHPGYSFL